MPARYISRDLRINIETTNRRCRICRAWNQEQEKGDVVQTRSIQMRIKLYDPPQQEILHTMPRQREAPDRSTVPPPTNTYISSHYHTPLLLVPRLILLPKYSCQSRVAVCSCNVRKAMLISAISLFFSAALWTKQFDL